ncbi:MAG: helicase-exonuclease AddAB subunit AddA [Defluviitaleaceae bacterium]|nr:helicase-exonuclease AddAB subunit AddA [Defluviitaleaceae bacterium]
MNNFTPAQREAIFCNASEILVSAAAGSGKTAVLTERIIRHISEGVSLDRLLVVTFTEAASAEMRERISKRLSENENLSHHAAMLPMADISTIHAFCRKLIRENFTEIDIDPAFKVGDDAELSLVRSQVMDELFEAEYSREDNADFIDLVDVYGGKTSDGRLDALVRGIYDFMESDPFPGEAAKRYAAVFENIHDLDATPWAAIAREELALGLDGAINSLRQAIKICNAPGGPCKYVEKLQDEIEMLEDLPFSSFEEMYDAFSRIEWGRLPTITAKDEVDPILKERVQRIRNKTVKERVKKLVQGVFFAPPDKMTDDLKALSPRVAALMRLACRFSEEYAKEKRARNIMDFSDLEHFAIKILYPNGPEDMHPQSPEQKYFEVLIDEYQDSNEIQDLILSAVAERRFMVGDVKQSIYRFRRANPGLFRKKYEQFQDHGERVRIDLSHNFRSRPEVLNAVNFFFSQLMCREVGDVNYDGAAALHPGHAVYPETDENPQMWIELLDQSGDENEETDETDDEPISNIIAETRVLAECINELLAARKIWDEEKKEFRECRQGDIAILSRSFSGIAGEVIEELKIYGIDAIADLNEGFFEQQEIRTALAFLRVADNPRTDIDLITVLTSPVYALTADELFEISRAEVSGDFYEKLKYFSHSGNLKDKIHAFFKDLESFRSAAVHLPISRLIGFIYDTTKYPAHVANMPGGIIRQANLRLLFERAIEFEETSLKGLFHFIRYIERLSAAGGVASAAEPSANSADKVRLMTIHKSKGLEFPIVICAFLAKKFNTEDERRPVILHSAEGIGPYYINTTLRTRSNTLARFGLSRLTRRENLSEELRCLYVAMTRAKELLILTGRTKNLQDSMEKWSDHLGNLASTLPTHYRRNVTSYLDWIMPCILRRKDAEQYFRLRPWGENLFVNKKVLPPPKKNLIIERETASLSSLPAKYSSLPSKLSISEIKRLYDITPDSSFRETETITPVFEPPSFIKAESGMTAMRMGSALHKVTEFIDYERHTSLGEIEELIAGLAEKNLLAPEEAAALDREKIEKLTNSPIAERLRKAAARSKLYRETPFVLALPAKQLYPEIENADEKILVHGIIDCHFEEDGKWILLDFKSDKIPHTATLNEWAETHRIQLEIYKQALIEATRTEVAETLLYSFARGEVAALQVPTPPEFQL